MRAMACLQAIAVCAAITCIHPSSAAAATPGGVELDWLNGQWCSQAEGPRVEETWLAPVGGRLHGLSRTSSGQQVMSFEFMWITPMDGVVTFHASPNGGPPTAFPRTAGGADWVRFENPAHDFPNRIDYRVREGHLLANISGPGADGKPMAIGFDYVPCKAVSSP